MSENVDNRVLSQAMLLDGMYPGIVEKWSAQAAALEAELALLKEQRIQDFVDGARWWEYEKTGATMWGSDREKAEAGAVVHFEAQALRRIAGLELIKEQEV